MKNKDERHPIAVQIAERLADELKEERPREPASTTATPDIQVWRQWIADVQAVARIVCETETERALFYKRVGYQRVGAPAR